MKPDHSQGKEKGLETTLREKVTPLLDEMMERHWGITIPKLGMDITDQLKKPELQVYIPQHLPYPKAKKLFKKEFIKKELRLHQGNVSRLAHVLSIDRRSIHRTIKDLAIDVEELRAAPESKEEYQQSVIDQRIRSTLDQYKELIQPQKMEKLYQELPALSRNIAKFLPHQELGWKEAEREFECQFLVQALEEQAWNVARTAAALGIRAETLHRKIKKLGLRKG